MKAQQATVHPKLVTQLERHFLQHGVPSSAQPQHPLGFRLSRPPADNSFKMLRQASSTSLAPICNFNRPHQSLSLIPALSKSSLGTPLGLGGAQRQPAQPGRPLYLQDQLWGPHHLSFGVRGWGSPAVQTCCSGQLRLSANPSSGLYTSYRWSINLSFACSGGRPRPCRLAYAR